MVTIGGFLIDAVLVEGHNLDSVTTEHPIEEGADITDHIRILPDKVTIEGIVSNTPIGEVASIRENEAPFAGEFLPAADALAFLRKIRADREPVRVETTIIVYDNMVMINLNIPQTARTGDSFQFRATFQEVQIVKTERTAVEVSVPIASRKSNLGTKPSEEVKDSQALERERQFHAATNEKWNRPFDPSLGRDLL